MVGSSAAWERLVGGMEGGGRELTGAGVPSLMGTSPVGAAKVCSGVASAAERFSGADIVIIEVPRSGTILYN